MLHYTLNTLNKTGFFLLGSNKLYNYNMTSFLFFSRNNFFLVDVVQFVFFLRKSLYMFEKFYLTRSKILFVLEDNVLKKQINKVLINFFRSIKNLGVNTYLKNTYFNLKANSNSKDFSKENNLFLDLSLKYNFNKFGLKNVSLDKNFIFLENLKFFLDFYYKKSNFKYLKLKSKNHKIVDSNFIMYNLSKNYLRFLNSSNLILKNSNIKFFNYYFFFHNFIVLLNNEYSKVLNNLLDTFIYTCFDFDIFEEEDYIVLILNYFNFLKNKSLSLNNYLNIFTLNQHINYLKLKLFFKKDFSKYQILLLNNNNKFNFFKKFDITFFKPI